EPGAYDDRIDVALCHVSSSTATVAVKLIYYPDRGMNTTAGGSPLRIFKIVIPAKAGIQAGWYLLRALVPAFEAVDFRRNDVAVSPRPRRRGMNSPAESTKSPLKGTPNLCLQSA